MMWKPEKQRGKAADGETGRASRGSDEVCAYHIEEHRGTCHSRKIERPNPFWRIPRLRERGDCLWILAALPKAKQKAMKCLQRFAKSLQITFTETHLTTGI